MMMTVFWVLVVPIFWERLICFIPKTLRIAMLCILNNWMCRVVVPYLWRFHLIHAVKQQRMMMMMARTKEESTRIEELECNFIICMFFFLFWYYFVCVWCYFMYLFHNEYLKKKK